MATHQCPRCTRPIPDAGTVCTTCTAAAHTTLRQIPALLLELERTTLRGDRITRTGTTPPPPLPGDEDTRTTSLPWDEHAARTAATLERTCQRIALRLLRHTHGGPCTHPTCHTGHRPRCPAWAPTRLITRYPWTYIDHHLPELRMTPLAVWALDDLDRHARAGWAAIDRPEDRYYAGPCGSTTLDTDGTTTLPCPVVLWSELDQPTITCPRCHARWDVSARRSWLLTAARDVTAPAAHIASALTLMTRRHVAPSTIRSWAHRGQLHRTDDPPGPRPLYRVGDVLDLLDPPQPAAPAPTAPPTTTEVPT